MNSRTLSSSAGRVAWMPVGERGEAGEDGAGKMTGVEVRSREE